MTKKINKQEGTKKAEKVDSVKKTEEVNKINEISKISGVSSVSKVSRKNAIDAPGPRLSINNQDQVLKTIDSEAEKMFAGKRIPRKRQKTITDALKMAVLAATLDEDEEEKDN